MIVILRLGFIAYIPDCRFDLGLKKSNAELTCRNNGNGKRFRLIVKDPFVEPK